MFLSYECNTTSFYLADSGCSIYIKGIKPDKDNEYSGEITINGNPTRLERNVREGFN